MNGSELPSLPTSSPEKTITSDYFSMDTTNADLNNADLNNNTQGKIIFAYPDRISSPHHPPHAEEPDHLAKHHSAKG